MGLGHEKNALRRYMCSLGENLSHSQSAEKTHFYNGAHPSPMLFWGAMALLLSRLLKHPQIERQM